MAKHLDDHFNARIFVSQSLENFLQKNKKLIGSSKKLKRTYIRGDETLKENERIPKIYYQGLINSYKKMYKKNQSQYTINNFLFTHTYNKKQKIKCNFDMGLYQSSLFLINDQKVASNLFGLKESKNSFMAASSIKHNKFETFKNSFIFTGSSNVRSASICSFVKNDSNTFATLWFFSTQSRDPGQHLYHLTQYSIENVKSARELTSLLSFSRHQFLKNPVRLIIESRKSTDTQLNELLKLNVPIYNAKKLGAIWSNYENKNQSSFILDERRQGHITCR